MPMASAMAPAASPLSPACTSRRKAARRCSCAKAASARTTAVESIDISIILEISKYRTSSRCGIEIRVTRIRQIAQPPCRKARKKGRGAPGGNSPASLSILACRPHPPRFPMRLPVADGLFGEGEGYGEDVPPVTPARLCGLSPAGQSPALIRGPAFFVYRQSRSARLPARPHHPKAHAACWSSSSMRSQISTSALVNSRIIASVCAGPGVKRSRSVPRGTVGKLIGCT